MEDSNCELSAIAWPLEDSCSTVSAEFHFSKGNSELLMWVDYVVERMIRKLAQEGFVSEASEKEGQK